MPRLMHRLHGGPPAHFCLHWRQAPLEFVSKELKPIVREAHQDLVRRASRAARVNLCAPQPMPPPLLRLDLHAVS